MSCTNACDPKSNSEREFVKSKSINIKIDIDPSVSEPEVIIRTDEETPLIEQIVSAIQQCAGPDLQKLPAYRTDTLCVSLIDQRDIIRIYTENRRLIISTRDGEYWMRSTLRELEAILDADLFVRISRYEIVGINWISEFDFSMSGTIKILFEDGSSTWVARRYVQIIEQRLALPGQKGGTSHE